MRFWGDNYSMSNSRESFLPKRRILVSLGVLGFGLAILAGAGGVVAAFLLLGVVREDKATICPSLEKIYSLTDIVGTTRTCFEDQHLKLRDLESEVDSYEMRFKEVVEEIPDPEIYALASPLKDHFTLFVEEGLAYQRGRVALEDNWRQAQLVNRRSKVLQTKLEAFQGQVLERYRGRLVQMDAYGQGFLCLFLTLSFLSLALGAVCLWVLRGGLKRADSKGDQLRVDLEASEGRDLAKTQFLSLISHGMRTPISGVLGMAELLGESHLNNVQKKYLENIVEAAEAQLPFLDNILDMSRSDAEKISLDAQPFSLRQLLGEVVSQLKGLAEKEGVSIRLLLSPLVPLSLRGDRPKVCRIVYNLLQKVIVFSDEGVIVVKVSSTLLDRSALTKVELTVAYRGGPRIEEDSAFAFESLVQRDDPASRHWSGVCLGLSICRDLCRWMGGNLEPEHDGVQQVFRAQLLLELESEGVPQVLALNGKKVLLSFEDDVLESYFREQLEHWGFVVELVNQGMLQELLVESDFSGVDLLFCCSEVISNLPPSLQLSCSVPLL
jgi:signal transduction histidine kinase